MSSSKLSPQLFADFGRKLHWKHGIGDVSEVLILS